MRRSWLGPLVISVLIATSCDLVGVGGSGAVITETRRVGGFSEIVLGGSGRATIEVTGEDSLTIEAEDNLMPLLTSEVVGGVLELGATEAISPTIEIVYTITVASLEAITVQGSGEISGAGFDAEVFAVTVSGSGNVILTDLTSDELVVRISGSGDAELSGSADHLKLDVSGSGDYLGEGLVSMTADVAVSGSGMATVNVTDDLDADVSGSGSITYFGDPASVDSSISGSGDVEEG